MMCEGRRSSSLRFFRSLPKRKAFEELSHLKLIFATHPAGVAGRALALWLDIYFRHCRHFLNSEESGDSCA